MQVPLFYQINKKSNAAAAADTPAAAANTNRRVAVKKVPLLLVAPIALITGGSSNGSERWSNATVPIRAARRRLHFRRLSTRRLPERWRLAGGNRLEIGALRMSRSSPRRGVRVRRRIALVWELAIL